MKRKRKVQVWWHDHDTKGWTVPEIGENDCYVLVGTWWAQCVWFEATVGAKWVSVTLVRWDRGGFNSQARQRMSGIGFTRDKWIQGWGPHYSYYQILIVEESQPITYKDVACYILAERSAWHELGGYNFDALHVVLEAYTSGTLWELLVHGCMDGTGLQGCGRYPRHTRCSGGICMFCASRLDWHENSDLRSKSTTGTV